MVPEDIPIARLESYAFAVAVPATNWGKLGVHTVFAFRNTPDETTTADTPVPPVVKKYQLMTGVVPPVKTPDVVTVSDRILMYLPAVPSIRLNQPSVATV